MKVNTIPFEVGSATGGGATSKDSLPKKLQPDDSVRPAPVEFDHGYNSTQPPIRPVVNGQGLGLEFSIDKELGVTIVKVLDVESGEVVRQIPPEETLNYLRQLESMMGKIFSRAL